MTTYRDRHLAGIYTPGQQRTTDELREALRILGQPTSGNKADLEKRLAKTQKQA